jgi:hypothetical protein
MAVHNVFWSGGEGFDIHVVAGASSRALNTLLAVTHGAPPQSVFANNLPAGITAAFRPEFNGALAGVNFSGHGVTVNTATGVVSVASPIPAGPRLRSFLLRAEVTDATGGAPVVHPIQPRIRVHVHTAITRVWLTPSTLTIRRQADGQRFAVLAEFDDQTVGEISNVPGLAWASSAAGSIAVNAGTGALTAVTDGSNADITVTLPAAYGGGSATARVESLAPWSTPVAASLVAGSPGRARMAEVLNILFVSDGFTAAEQPRFEQLVNALVRFLRTARATRPYDLCKDEINYWMAFVASRERGTSTLYAMKPVTRRLLVWGQEIPRPTPPGAGAGTWTLPQLIHEVGLPVPADNAIPFATKQTQWTTLYGGHVAGRVNAALHKQWLDLRDWRLANERDTAFGVAVGSRPNVANGKEHRTITWHPRRTQRAHIENFVTNLTDSPGGPQIGAVWGLGGKDRMFVIVLCGGARFGGGRTRPPIELITSALVDPKEVRLQAAAGTRGFDLLSHPLPAAPASHANSTVAHECAHAFGLGDEYGGALNLPASEVARVADYLNLQDLASASRPVPGIGLDGARIAWNDWPRIAKAGVLTAQPGPVGARFRLVLRADHARPFAVGDRVRLRTRPLRHGIVPSGELEVTDVAGNELEVRDVGGGLVPAVFPAGSIVYLPVTGAPPAAAVQPLIAPIISAHITTTGLPLNVAAGTPLPRICEADDNVIQRPRNLPAMLPPGRPRYPAWIVGAYEGGMEYHCGVLHPSGACMMRALVVPGRRAVYNFCPVCRYILVDAIDPSKHGGIDADYARQYPEP